MPKFCIRCGAALKPDAKFCVACGKPVGSASAEVPPATDRTPPASTAQPVQASRSLSAPNARPKRRLTPVAIGGITLGALLVFIGIYYLVQATVPRESAPTATASIAWDTLPVTAKLISYGEIEDSMVFEDELLVIRDCQFQSTDACQIDFAGISVTLSFTRASADDPWKKDFLGFSGTAVYKSPETGYALTDLGDNRITVWPAVGDATLMADDEGQLHFPNFMIYDEHFDEPYFTLDMAYYPDGGFLTGVDGIHTNGSGYSIYLDESFVPVDCDTPFVTVG
jgi:hypothetical protein